MDYYDLVFLLGTQEIYGAYRQSNMVVSATLLLQTTIGEFARCGNTLDTKYHA
jgi:hypothetical protein